MINSQNSDVGFAYYLHAFPTYRSNSNPSIFIHNTVFTVVDFSPPLVLIQAWEVVRTVSCKTVLHYCHADVKHHCTYSTLYNKCTLVYSVMLNFHVDVLVLYTFIEESIQPVYRWM